MCPQEQFLSRAVRGGLQGKVTLGERPQGKQETQWCLGTVPRQRDQPVQRPWGELSSRDWKEASWPQLGEWG